MSKSIEIIILRKIKNILSTRKLAPVHIPDIGPDAIPSISALNIPSLSDIGSGPDYLYTHVVSQNQPVCGECSSQRMLPGVTAYNEEDDCDDDQQPEIISILENTGYRIKEVKSLASGEKVITVDQIISQMNSVPDYEYAARSKYE